jgi:hypothetical protein
MGREGSKLPNYRSSLVERRVLRNRLRRLHQLDKKIDQSESDILEIVELYKQISSSPIGQTALQTARLSPRKRIPQWRNDYLSQFNPNVFVKVRLHKKQGKFLWIPVSIIPMKICKFLGLTERKIEDVTFTP